MIPGMPEGTEPVAPDPSDPMSDPANVAIASNLVATLDQNDRDLQEALGEAVESVNTVILANATELGAALGEAEGRLINDVNANDALLGRHVGKAWDRLIGVVGENYRTLEGAGVPTPSMAEVDNELASADAGLYISRLLGEAVAPAGDDPPALPAQVEPIAANVDLTGRPKDPIVVPFGTLTTQQVCPDGTAQWLRNDMVRGDVPLQPGYGRYVRIDPSQPESSWPIRDIPLSVWDANHWCANDTGTRCDPWGNPGNHANYFCCGGCKPEPQTAPPLAPPPPAEGGCPPPTIVVNCGQCGQPVKPSLVEPFGNIQSTVEPPKVPEPPKPPKPPKPPTGQVPTPRLPWDDPLRCHDIADDFCEQVAPFTLNTQTGGVEPNRNNLIGQIIGWSAEWFSAPAHATVDVVNALIAQLLSASDDMITRAGSIMGTTFGQCSTFAGTILTAAGFLERWVGAPTDYVFQPVRYLLQYSMPVYILPQSELDRLYLLELFDDTTWECYTKANGNLPNIHRIARDAQGVRTSIQEEIDIYMRSNRGATARHELGRALRQRGVLDDANIDKWLHLQESKPSVSDIIQYMRKEAVDPNAIEDMNLDGGFQLATDPIIRHYAAQIGVTPERLLLEWRSHWQPVPLGYIAEMRARLRPGNPNVPDELVVTDDMARRMVRYADYSPAMADRLIAIQNRAINRTDLIKAYNAGTIDAGELYERMQDILYSPEDARLMADLLTDDKRRRVITNARQWNPARVGYAYRDGTLTRDEAVVLLQAFYKDDASIQQLLDGADLQRVANARKACIKGVRRRYFVGEMNRAEAQDQLEGHDIAQHVAFQLTSQWECEIVAARKEPTVKMLIEWYEIGIIDVIELSRRLGNLRYSAEDTQNIIRRALVDIERRREADRRREEAYQRAQQNRSNGQRRAATGRSAQASAQPRVNGRFARAEPQSPPSSGDSPG